MVKNKNTRHSSLGGRKIMNKEENNIIPKREKHNYISYALILIGLLYLIIMKRFDILLYIGSVCLSFGLIVLIHEGGHFLAAKAVGIRVNEFALGMGPKIFGIRKGETLYTLRALPIGGYIKPEGEDEESNDPRGFNNVSLWKRTAVVAAGPLANLILAFGIIIALIFFAGVPSIVIDTPLTFSATNTVLVKNGDVVKMVNNKKIFLMDEFYENVSNVSGDSVNFTLMRNNNEINVTVPSIKSQLIDKKVVSLNTVLVGDITEGSPASKSQLKTGDIVTKLNGYDIYVPEEVLAVVSKSDGSPMEVKFNRAGKEITTTIIPTYSNEYGRYIIGISFLPFFEGDFYKYSYSENFENSMLYSGELFNQLGSWVKRLFAGKVTKDEVGGPVKIISITVEVTKQGLYPFIHFIALLSLSLGIFNLFPIPALDGGRLVFFGIEAIRRKPVNQKIEGMIHFFGFILLILFLIFVTFNDVRDLVVH